MKCINCQTDNNLRDRTGNYGRCKQCNHTFVFEPTNTQNKYKITDGLFAKLLVDISANNTIAYTNKQLRYQLDRKAKRKANYTNLGWAIAYVFLIGFPTFFMGTFASIALKSFAGMGIIFVLMNLIFMGFIFRDIKNPVTGSHNRQKSVEIFKYQGLFLMVLAIVQIFSPALASTAILTLLTGIGGIWLHLYTKQKFVNMAEDWGIDLSQFTDRFSAWQTINGTPDRLLSAPQQLAISPTVDPDITAYSFDRLVVTDRDEIAHFLIANNFHFEHNCAILSINEYPSEIFDTVMTMLRRNEDLQVFALHDCSPIGVSLIDRLRTSDRWFAQQAATIIDLGLLPRQIIGSKSNLVIRNSVTAAAEARDLNPTLKQSLSTEELTWLELGNYVELESFPPLRLLQIVQQSIARSRDLATIDDGGGLIVVDNYGGDSGMMYTVDSFG
jgi:hypothetical protein